jgi:hypothetical protein
MGAGNRLSEPFSDASRFEVYTAGQKRRVTPQIKREFKRRAAVDPVIGHLKAEHRILAGSTAFVGRFRTAACCDTLELANTCSQCSWKTSQFHHV